LITNLIKKTVFYKRFNSFIEAKIAGSIKGHLKENLWELLPATGQEKTIKKTHDILINCYYDSILSREIFYERFEEEEITFLKRILKPGDSFIDIGANIGLFSLIASPIIGEKGEIISFEPCSPTLHRFEENISLNNFKNIITNKQAISNKNGKATLQIASDGYDAWNSIAEPAKGEVFETEEIDTITFDDYISNSQIDISKIALVKIDVEGWEMPVLEGGKEFFSSAEAPSLIVEFTEANAANAGYSCTDLYHALVDYGYSLFTYDASNNRLIPEKLREHYPYLNIIATKDLQFVEKRLSL